MLLKYSDALKGYYNLIYILPVLNKPLKVIFDDFPCPLDFTMRCKSSKNISDEFSFGFDCTNKNRNIDNCRLMKMIIENNRED